MSGGYGHDGFGGQDDGMPPIGELTGPARYPAETMTEVKRALGLNVPRSVHGRKLGQDPLPDVGGLAREIGLDG